MPTRTDYHDIKIPEDGADEGVWGEILTTALDDDIDDKLIRRGAFTGRPTSAPDEALYLATDRQVLYRYDGASSSWDTAIEGGTDTPIYHVTPGDSASLRSQLNAARDNGGGVVYVPEGTYPLTTRLYIYSDTTLICAHGATILRDANDITGLLYTGGDHADGQNPPRQENITVAGGVWDLAASQFSASAEGMAFKPATDVTVRDVTIKNIKGWHHITFGAVHDGAIINCRFENGYSMGDASGMIQLEEDYANTDDCRNILIDNNAFVQDATSGGAAVDSHHFSPTGAQQRAVTIRDNYVTGTGKGFYLEDIEKVVARGNTLEGVTGNGFEFDSKCEDMRLSDNRLDGAPVANNGKWLTRNGVGTNSGDPTAGSGEWSNAGYEGLLVYDTSTPRPYSAYRYIGGQWQTA